jgi:methyl-accepting chemotaxis protein
VQQARALAEELQLSLSEPENQALAEQILDGTRNFEEELTQMASLNEDAQRQIFDLNGIGFSAQQRAEYLSASDSSAMSWLVRLVGIRLTQKDFALSRDEIDAMQLSSRLRGLLVTLENRINMRPDEDVKELHELLKQFQQQQERFIEAINGLVAVEERIDVLAQGIAEGAATLLANQQASMGRQSDWSRIIILSVTAAALVLGVLFAWLITLGIINPLKLLVSQANRIAEGDLSQDIRHQRKDELGQLMQAMQHMTENLRDLLTRLTSGIEQLATATEEMSAVTEQTSAGVTQQKMDTEQVATAMNQMTATVLEVARSAEAAAGSAQEADGQARQGAQVVQQAIGRIESLAGQSRNRPEP